RGERSNLILIGFDRYPHIVSDIENMISPSSLLKVRGGHSGWGKEMDSFDQKAVEAFAESRAGELFTVSSLYSPRNPEHETAAKIALTANGAAHVTCSHELSYSKLNSVKRTVTAYLNTSLVPVANRLLDDINSAVKKYKISCPVMFLKSDSTLVPSEWCRRFPIEMIYSGPAASLRGACHIAGGDQRSFIVADIGGTSTDIGRIEEGRAVFSEEGAKIGRYRTMIPSLDIMSIALGGDSRIEFSGTNEIIVGPERSVPLCRTPDETGLSAGCLISRLREVPHDENDIAGSLTDGCSESSSGRNESLAGYIKSFFCRKKEFSLFSLRKLMRQNISYTPTDAFNTIGASSVGDTEISQAVSCWLGEIYETAGFDLAEQISEKAVSILEEAVREYQSKCEFESMRRVYVGTPARVFAKLGDNQGLEIIVPENFDVAGAVGAAVSSMELSCRVFIMHSFSDDSFTAFLPEATISSTDFHGLLNKAEAAGKRYLRKQAKNMGYTEPKIIVDKNFSYAGQKENIASLLSVSMEFRTAPDNPQ
ncbi:MAG: hydantoinase/oxoprolinase family protein, partial [Synergistaceae bacterium]|nr:hydantoinase/oxoprolinase family protein [Synergistaceae bacterium]